MRPFQYFYTDKNLNAININFNDKKDLKRIITDIMKNQGRETFIDTVCQVLKEHGDKELSESIQRERRLLTMLGKRWEI